MTQIPPKAQNNPKTYKMTKMPLEPQKMTKISPEIQKITKIPPKQKNDWNNPWKKKTKIPLKSIQLPKYPQNLKDYQNTPET